MTNTNTPRVQIYVESETTYTGGGYTWPTVDISVSFDYGDGEQALASLKHKYNLAVKQIEETLDAAR